MGWRCRGQWMNNYQEETSGLGGFWLNGPNRILAEGGPGWSDVSWGLGGGWGTSSDMEGDQILRMGDQGLGEKRVQRRLSRTWSKRESLSVDGVRTKPETRWLAGLWLALLSAETAVQTTVLSPSVLGDLQDQPQVQCFTRRIHRTHQSCHTNS